MDFSKNEPLAPMAIEKIKSWGPFWSYRLNSPFGPIFEVDGLDWQCYLAGSSKTAPQDFDFSIAIALVPITLMSIIVHL